MLLRYMKTTRQLIIYSGSIHYKFTKETFVVKVVQINNTVLLKVIGIFLQIQLFVFQNVAQSMM